MEDDNVVVISESEEDEEDEEVVYTRKSSNKQYQLLWEKVKTILYYRLLPGCKLPTSFPYATFQELANDLKKSLALINTQSTQAFILKNLIRWLLAIKLSYENVSDCVNDRNYNLILTELMAHFVNYKCQLYSHITDETEVGAISNEIVDTLNLVFSGWVPGILMTLLKIRVINEYRLILYPIFMKYLSNKHLHETSDLISYLRLILCFRKWKQLVPLKEDKEIINEIAVGKLAKALKSDIIDLSTESVYIDPVLPKTVPADNEDNRSFANITSLIGFASKNQYGTRILLINKSLELEDTIEQFFKRYSEYINRSTPNLLEWSTANLQPILIEDLTRSPSPEQMLPRTSCTTRESSQATNKNKSIGKQGTKAVNHYLSNSCDISSISVNNKSKHLNLNSHTIENLSPSCKNSQNRDNDVVLSLSLKNVVYLDDTDDEYDNSEIDTSASGRNSNAKPMTEFEKRIADTIEKLKNRAIMVGDLLNRVNDKRINNSPVEILSDESSESHAELPAVQSVNNNVQVSITNPVQMFALAKSPKPTRKRHGIVSSTTSFEGTGDDSDNSEDDDGFGVHNSSFPQRSSFKVVEEATSSTIEVTKIHSNFPSPTQIPISNISPPSTIRSGSLSRLGLSQQSRITMGKTDEERPTCSRYVTMSMCFETPTTVDDKLPEKESNIYSLKNKCGPDKHRTQIFKTPTTVGNNESNDDASSMKSEANLFQTQSKIQCNDIERTAQIFFEKEDENKVKPFKHLMAAKYTNLSLDTKNKPQNNKDIPQKEITIKENLTENQSNKDSLKNKPGTVKTEISKTPTTVGNDESNANASSKKNGANLSQTEAKNPCNNVYDKPTANIHFLESNNDKECLEHEVSTILAYDGDHETPELVKGEISFKLINEQITNKTDSKEDYSNKNHEEIFDEICKTKVVEKSKALGDEGFQAILKEESSMDDDIESPPYELICQSENLDMSAEKTKEILNSDQNYSDSSRNYQSFEKQKNLQNLNGSSRASSPVELASMSKKTFNTTKDSNYRVINELKREGNADEPTHEKVNDFFQKDNCFENLSFIYDKSFTNCESDVQPDIVDKIVKDLHKPTVVSETKLLLEKQVCKLNDSECSIQSEFEHVVEKTAAKDQCKNDKLKLTTKNASERKFSVKNDMQQSNWKISVQGGDQIREICQENVIESIQIPTHLGLGVSKCLRTGIKSGDIKRDMKIPTKGSVNINSLQENKIETQHYSTNPVQLDSQQPYLKQAAKSLTEGPILRQNETSNEAHGSNKVIVTFSPSISIPLKCQTEEKLTYTEKYSIEEFNPPNIQLTNFLQNIVQCKDELINNQNQTDFSQITHAKLQNGTEPDSSSQVSNYKLNKLQTNEATSTEKESNLSTAAQFADQGEHSSIADLEIFQQNAKLTSESNRSIIFYPSTESAEDLEVSDITSKTNSDSKNCYNYDEENGTPVQDEKGITEEESPLNLKITCLSKLKVPTVLPLTGTGKQQVDNAPQISIYPQIIDKMRFIIETPLVTPEDPAFNEEQYEQPTSVTFEPSERTAEINLLQTSITDVGSTKETADDQNEENDLEITPKQPEKVKRKNEAISATKCKRKTVKQANKEQSNTEIEESKECEQEQVDNKSLISIHPQNINKMLLGIDIPSVTPKDQVFNEDQNDQPTSVTFQPPERTACKGRPRAISATKYKRKTAKQTNKEQSNTESEESKECEQDQVDNKSLISIHTQNIHKMLLGIDIPPVTPKDPAFNEEQYEQPTSVAFEPSERTAEMNLLQTSITDVGSTKETADDQNEENDLEITPKQPEKVKRKNETISANKCKRKTAKQTNKEQSNTKIEESKECEQEQVDNKSLISIHTQNIHKMLLGIDIPPVTPKDPAFNEEQYEQPTSVAFEPSERTAEMNLLQNSVTDVGSTKETADDQNEEKDLEITPKPPEKVKRKNEAISGTKCKRKIAKQTNKEQSNTEIEESKECEQEQVDNKSLISIHPQNINKMLLGIDIPSVTPKDQVCNEDQNDQPTSVTFQPSERTACKGRPRAISATKYKRKTAKQTNKEQSNTESEESKEGKQEQVDNKSLISIHPQNINKMLLGIDIPSVTPKDQVFNEDQNDQPTSVTFQPSERTACKGRPRAISATKYKRKTAKQTNKEQSNTESEESKEGKQEQVDNKSLISIHTQNIHKMLLGIDIPPVTPKDPAFNEEQYEQPTSVAFEPSERTAEMNLLQTSITDVGSTKETADDQNEENDLEITPKQPEKVKRKNETISANKCKRKTAKQTNKEQSNTKIEESKECEQEQVDNKSLISIHPQNINKMLLGIDIPSVTPKDQVCNEDQNDQPTSVTFQPSERTACKGRPRAISATKYKRKTAKQTNKEQSNTESEESKEGKQEQVDNKSLISIHPQNINKMLLGIDIPSVTPKDQVFNEDQNDQPTSVTFQPSERTACKGRPRAISATKYKRKTAKQTNKEQSNTEIEESKECEQEQVDNKSLISIHPQNINKMLLGIDIPSVTPKDQVFNEDQNDQPTSVTFQPSERTACKGRPRAISATKYKRKTAKQTNKEQSNTESEESKEGKQEQVDNKSLISIHPQNINKMLLGIDIPPVNPKDPAFNEKQYEQPTSVAFEPSERTAEMNLLQTSITDVGSTKETTDDQNEENDLEITPKQPEKVKRKNKAISATKCKRKTAKQTNKEQSNTKIEESKECEQEQVGNKSLISIHPQNINKMLLGIDIPSVTPKDPVFNEDQNDQPTSVTFQPSERTACKGRPRAISATKYKRKTAKQTNKEQSNTESEESKEGKQEQVDNKSLISIHPQNINKMLLGIDIPPVNPKDPAFNEEQYEQPTSVTFEPSERTAEMNLLQTFITDVGSTKETADDQNEENDLEITPKQPEKVKRKNEAISGTKCKRKTAKQTNKEQSNTESEESKEGKQEQVDNKSLISIHPQNINKMLLGIDIPSATPKDPAVNEEQYEQPTSVTFEPSERTAEINLLQTSITDVGSTKETADDQNEENDLEITPKQPEKVKRKNEAISGTKCKRKTAKQTNKEQSNTEIEESKECEQEQVDNKSLISIHRQNIHKILLGINIPSVTPKDPAFNEEQYEQPTSVAFEPSERTAEMNLLQTSITDVGSTKETADDQNEENDLEITPKQPEKVKRKNEAISATKCKRKTAKQTNKEQSNTESEESKEGKQEQVDNKSLISIHPQNINKMLLGIDIPSVTPKDPVFNEDQNDQPTSVTFQPSERAACKGRPRAISATKYKRKTAKQTNKEQSNTESEESKEGKQEQVDDTSLIPIHPQNINKMLLGIDITSVTPKDPVCNEDQNDQPTSVTFQPSERTDEMNLLQTSITDVGSTKETADDQNEENHLEITPKQPEKVKRKKEEPTTLEVQTKFVILPAFTNMKVEESNQSGISSKTVKPAKSISISQLTELSEIVPENKTASLTETEINKIDLKEKNIAKVEDKNMGDRNSIAETFNTKVEIFNLSDVGKLVKPTENEANKSTKKKTIDLNESCLPSYVFASNKKHGDKDMDSGDFVVITEDQPKKELTSSIIETTSSTEKAKSSPKEAISLDATLEESIFKVFNNLQVSYNKKSTNQESGLPVNADTNQIIMKPEGKPPSLDGVQNISSCRRINSNNLELELISFDVISNATFEKEKTSVIGEKRSVGGRTSEYEVNDAPKKNKTKHFKCPRPKTAPEKKETTMEIISKSKLKSSPKAYWRIKPKVVTETLISSDNASNKSDILTDDPFDRLKKDTPFNTFTKTKSIPDVSSIHSISKEQNYQCNSNFNNSSNLVKTNAFYREPDENQKSLLDSTNLKNTCLTNEVGETKQNSTDQTKEIDVYLDNNVLQNSKEPMTQTIIPSIKKLNDSFDRLKNESSVNTCLSKSSKLSLNTDKSSKSPNAAVPIVTKTQSIVVVASIRSNDQGNSSSNNSSNSVKTNASYKEPDENQKSLLDSNNLKKEVGETKQNSSDQTKEIDVCLDNNVLQNSKEPMTQTIILSIKKSNDPFDRLKNESSVNTCLSKSSKLSLKTDKSSRGPWAAVPIVTKTRSIVVVSSIRSNDQCNSNFNNSSNSVNTNASYKEPDENQKSLLDSNNLKNTCLAKNVGETKQNCGDQTKEIDVCLGNNVLQNSKELMTQTIIPSIKKSNDTFDQLKNESSVSTSCLSKSSKLSLKTDKSSRGVCAALPIVNKTQSILVASSIHSNDQCNLNFNNSSNSLKTNASYKEQAENQTSVLESNIYLSNIKVVQKLPPKIVCPTSSAKSIAIAVVSPLPSNSILSITPEILDPSEQIIPSNVSCSKKRLKQSSVTETPDLSVKINEPQQTPEYKNVTSFKPLLKRNITLCDVKEVEEPPPKICCSIFSTSSVTRKILDPSEQINPSNVSCSKKHSKQSSVTETPDPSVKINETQQTPEYKNVTSSKPLLKRNISICDVKEVEEPPPKVCCSIFPTSSVTRKILDPSEQILPSKMTCSKKHLKQSIVTKAPDSSVNINKTQRNFENKNVKALNRRPSVTSATSVSLKLQVSPSKIHTPTLNKNPYLNSTASSPSTSNANAHKKTITIPSMLQTASSRMTNQTLKTPLSFQSQSLRPPRTKTPTPNICSVDLARLNEELKQIQRKLSALPGYDVSYKVHRIRKELNSDLEKKQQEINNYHSELKHHQQQTKSNNLNIKHNSLSNSERQCSKGSTSRHSVHVTQLEKPNQCYVNKFSDKLEKNILTNNTEQSHDTNTHVQTLPPWDPIQPTTEEIIEKLRRK